nr:SDR family NAD(P)-dependent oxidoreductase [Candidatus Frankia alpina]
MGLLERIAVVTGASRGIGLAVVQALVAEGATVVAGARRSSPELDELAASGAVRVHLVDLATPTARPRSSSRPASGSTSWSTTSAPRPPGPVGSARSPTRCGWERST